MTSNSVFQLITRQGNLPWVAKYVGPRKPELFSLKQPHKTRESHVAPHFFFCRIGECGSQECVPTLRLMQKLYHRGVPTSAFQSAAD